MKLEQDLPTNFERLYFFKKYDLILKTTLSIDFNGAKTVEKILQNDIYICL